VKEREGVNETPRRGGLLCVSPPWLDSLSIIVGVDLGLMLEIFLF